ncbi:fimbrial biogenesis chaperone [Xanthomonas albilineans]|uniref:fimbrial biogenesis chaperone n=1 Tax=Xanthomonas albilineans TaxID=29447 RepID=UPI000695F361|nr:fimbria/pilus periplasmic chaperone [Xanthomonas albilineans]
MVGRPTTLASRWWLALLLLAGTASAGVRISPTLVQMTQDTMATEIWLTNTQDHPWQAKVQVYRWVQTDGVDQLQDTDAIQPSPQWINIPAQGKQLLRVIRTTTTNTTNETAYRLVLEEHDTAPTAADPSHLLLRYSTPIFVSAQDSTAAPVLSASLIPGAHGPELLIRNRGRVHARLSDLSFIGADGHRLALYANLSGYVLAGEQKRWPLPAAVAAAQGGHFAARLDDASPLQALPAE